MRPGTQSRKVSTSGQKQLCGGDLREGKGREGMEQELVGKAGFCEVSEGALML